MAKNNINQSPTTARNSGQSENLAEIVYRHGAPSKGLIPNHPAAQSKLEHEQQRDDQWLEDKDQQQQSGKVPNFMELHQKAAPGVFGKMDPETLKTLAEGAEASNLDATANQRGAK